jgi:hypothetical protein
MTANAPERPVDFDLPQQGLPLSIGARFAPLPQQGKGAGGIGVPPLLGSSQHLENENESSCDDKPGDFDSQWESWGSRVQREHAFTQIFCTSCGNIKPIPLHCKNRFCPVCSGSRRMRVQERLKWLLEQNPPTPRRTLKLLTLTIKSTPTVVQGLKKLTSAFKRLRQAKIWKIGACNGAWLVEVTGRPGSWHVHIHALMVSNYLNRDLIISQWKALTGAWNVDIRCVSVGKGIGYVTKYVSKGDFNPLYVEEVAAALAGYRLFQTFGSWHNLKAPKIKLVCTCALCGKTIWLPMRMIDFATRDVIYTVILNEERLRKGIPQQRCHKGS